MENYKRTKAGEFMYNLTMKCGKWLDKHVVAYWFLLISWGFIECLAALFVMIFLLITGHLPHKNHRGIYFFIGNNWGGFSLGFIQVIANNMGDDWTNHSIRHECGHSYQVCLLGPLWLFIVAIPSQIRWSINYYNDKHHISNKPYDAAWFEGSATDLGEEVCSHH